MVQLQLSRKRSNYRILVIFVLLLCPIASVPLIISGILNKRHELLPLLSFVMATLAILSPPFADLYRHALHFQYYKHSSVPISSIFMQKDYVLDLLEYYFAKWNLNFEFIRGLFVFVCYQIAFALYKELFKYLDGEWTLDFALDKIRRNSRVYAKKQLTWFKKDAGVRWLEL